MPSVRAHDVVDHGGKLLSGPDGFAAQPIEGAVASDRHHPSARIGGHPVARPCAQGFGEGFLDGVFGDGEVTGPARERGDGGAPFAPKDAVQVGHSC